MIEIHPQPAYTLDTEPAGAFLEIVCPACHTVSRRIRIDDQVEQRKFDDTHRRCYINAVPNGRA
jgi:transcription initiation factor TFIIIB Brf1 subunit/transcription initiation factor TFIIB